MHVDPSERWQNTLEWKQCQILPHILLDNCISLKHFTRLQHMAKFFEEHKFCGFLGWVTAPI